MFTPENPETTPRSEAQKAASRENGKKSHGPVTEEGKARSSQNATVHGLRSSRVVLANESQTLYDKLLAGYRELFNPVGQAEYDYTVQYVNACWRLRRVWGMENGMNDAEMFILKNNLDASFSHVTAPLRQADAFMSLAITNPDAVQLLARAEARLERSKDRALNMLIKLQTLRLGQAPTFNFNEKTIEPDENQCNFEETETFSWFSHYAHNISRPSPDRRGPVPASTPPPTEKAA